MMKTVLIDGMGLIGGSYASGLKKAGYTVYGKDIDAKAVEFAVRRGWIDNGSETDEERINRSDIILFALYPNDIVSAVRDCLPYVKRGVLMSDMSGIKCDLLNEVNRILPDGVRYISHHPMAGREKSGIEAADEKIFIGANFLIVGEKKCEELEEIASALHFGHIDYLSAEKHDEVIAYLSQLPHAISVALMNAKDPEHMMAYSGDSFRDLTRIAAINEDLWSGLFLGNREKLIREIDSFMKEMAGLRETLIRNDRESLCAQMKSAKDRRRRFDR